MVRDYFLNFWIWWYFVKGREVLGALLRAWLSVLGWLNVVPMISNLFVPLYQDYSVIGRFISFVIRFTWGFGGLVIFFACGAPFIALALLYLALPVVAVYQVLDYFI